MKKKILMLSTTIVVVLIVLAGLSPSICSKDIEPVQIGQFSDMITVDVKQYCGQQPENINTKLTYDEAVQIKEILIQLNDAIENNDEKTIKECESILNKKGIFGDNYQKFFSYNTYNDMLNTFKFSEFTKYLGTQNNDNISNLLCYFTAIGNGTLYHFLSVRIYEAIRSIVLNQTSIIGAVILLITLLPFLVIVMLLTSLIPFRILMPVGIVAMNKGSISSLGLQGRKKLVVEGPDSVNVNFSWFTGVTINIPFTDNPFVFVSGIAMKVQESDY